MIPRLAEQRCFHHPDREAAARCPSCTRFFCRECITEHEDRVICAECLRKLAAPAEQRRDRLRLFRLAAQLFLSLLAGWLFFYVSARLLLLIPTSFHDGTVWSGDSEE